MPGYVVANSNSGSGDARTWMVCVPPTDSSGCRAGSDVRSGLCCARHNETWIRQYAAGVRIPSVNLTAEPAAPVPAADMPAASVSSAVSDGINSVVALFTGGGESYSEAELQQKTQGTITGTSKSTTPGAETPTNTDNGGNTSILPWVFVGIGGVAAVGFMLFLIMRKK